MIEKPRNVSDLKQVVALLDEASAIRSSQARLLEVAKSLREGVMGMLPRPTKVAITSSPSTYESVAKRKRRPKAEQGRLFDLGPKVPKKRKRR